MTGTTSRTTASGITPLRKRESLREGVMRQIRGAIISGEMPPGEVYSAPALAARFGVSATPVREAMLDLARDGAVVVLPNKGFQVTEVSSRELDDITAIRQLLEPPTVRDATPGIPEGDLGLLHDLAQQIVDAADAEDLAGYLEGDREFHQRLLSYSGNRELVALVLSLRSRTRLYGLTALLEVGQLHQSAQEHHDIVDAVAARDPEAVHRLMVHHIGHVRGIWAAETAPASPAGRAAVSDA